MFMEIPVQRIGRTDHGAFDHKYNHTQDGLGE